MCVAAADHEGVEERKGEVVSESVVALNLRAFKAWVRLDF